MVFTNIHLRNLSCMLSWENLAEKGRFKVKVAAASPSTYPLRSRSFFSPFLFFLSSSLVTKWFAQKPWRLLWHLTSTVVSTKEWKEKKKRSADLRWFARTQRGAHCCMNSAACWPLIVIDAPSARRALRLGHLSEKKASRQRFSQSSILNFIFLSERRHFKKICTIDIFLLQSNNFIHRYQLDALCFISPFQTAPPRAFFLNSQRA